MHDMLRIMDVASTLRRGRETAEAQLDVATAKERLRERLLATAAAAGEAVTPAEVDAAIERYFATQHTYADPPPSWRRFLAHLWVLRLGCLTLLILFAIVVGGSIWLVGTIAGKSPGTSTSRTAVESTAPPVNPPPRQPPAPQPEAGLAAAWTAFQQVAAAAAKLAADDDARARVQSASAVGEAAHAASDLGRLQQARQRIDELVTRLEEEYTVTVVDRPGERSGIDRYFDGKLSGYYLIVEAKTADGRALSRRITSGETKRASNVTKWGEQIPEAVWQRIVADKKADGVVDEALFARKERGRHDETVVLDDGKGKPLRRGRQITEW